MRRLVPLAGSALVLAAGALLLTLPGGSPAPRPSGGLSEGAPRPGSVPSVDVRAMHLLQRAAAAPATTAYSGTQFVAAWTSDGTTSQVLDVTHSPSKGTTWRATGSRPGGASVHAAADAADPSLLGVGAVTLLARHYSLAAVAASRVAGRETDVVEARRAGPGEAVAARFWLDRASGLVLRREVYDSRGRVIRASAFVDVTVTPEGDPAGSGSGVGASGRAWAEAMDDAEVRRMRSRGWDCPEELPGPLPLVDARRGGEQGDIVHLSYADGIASISVFLQHGDLDQDSLRGYRYEKIAGRPVWVRSEVPRRVVWSSDGTVYTVIADAPERTVERAVRLLHEVESPRGGHPLDRLGRGLDRVASWFNPFE